MSTETITVTLPESIFRRLQRTAELTYHSVDEIITKMVNFTLKPPPNLPADLADELAAMTTRFGLLPNLLSPPPRNGA